VEAWRGARPTLGRCEMRTFLTILVGDEPETAKTILATGDREVVDVTLYALMERIAPKDRAVREELEDLLAGAGVTDGD
jgi:hypothetical protein